MRDELLNETLFFNLDHALQKLAAYAANYNISRPHSALGYRTPEPYAVHLTAKADPLRNPTAPRASLLLPPRQRA